MSETKVKLLEKHNEKCFYQKSGDINWFYNTYEPKEHISADKIFRKRKSAHYRWLMFGCNDPQCSARLAVRVDGIEDYAQRELLGLNP